MMWLGDALNRRVPVRTDVCGNAMLLIRERSMASTAGRRPRRVVQTTVGWMTASRNVKYCNRFGGQTPSELVQ